MKQRTKSRQWTIEEAMGLICDREQPLSRGVIGFLSGLGRAEMGRFADCWRDMPEERRRDLITNMVEMAEADFEMDFNAIFRWALQSEDPQIRERAVDGLWEDEQVSLIEPLARLMREDPDEAVRARAAASLGRFALLGELGDIAPDRATRVRDSLVQVVQDQDETDEVRRRAIESVAYMSDAPVREFIDAAYESTSDEMRISAVFAMGRTADPQWADVIVHEMRSNKPVMRYEAARAAGEIALRSATGSLIALLDDQDAEVRQMAIWALGQVGGAQARRALEACQDSQDEAMRDAAEDALSELEFATGPLDMFLFEPDAGEDDLEDDGLGE